MVSGYDKTPPPDDEQPQLELPWSFWAGVILVAAAAVGAWWLGLI